MGRRATPLVAGNWKMFKGPSETASFCAALAARLHALDGRLTRRELDVLARILSGLTSEGIALDLRVSVNTVLTYRKRAYGRLGVSSQAELFALCLA